MDKYKKTSLLSRVFHYILWKTGWLQKWNDRYWTVVPETELKPVYEQVQHPFDELNPAFDDERLNVFFKKGNPWPSWDFFFR